jgi:DNA-directed RNA polymerase specialized sigma subunit
MIYYTKILIKETEMKDYNVITDEKAPDQGLHGNYGLNRVSLNFDISSYPFDDIDLAMAVRKLNERDQRVIILHLMGYRHCDIAGLLNITRSNVTKKMASIMKNLALIMS